jgi:Tfp pilus assembly protein PilF
VQLSLLELRHSMKRGQAAENGGVLARALAAFPQNTRIQHALAVYLNMCGDGERAEAIMRRVHAQAPDNGMVLHMLGVLALQRGDRPAASKLLQHGCRVRSAAERMLCVEELAQLAVFEGRPEVARQLFQHAAAAAGGANVGAHFLCAWGAFERRQGNAEGARVLFQQAIERSAVYMRAWAAWANLERAEGDPGEAMRLLREVRVASRHWPPSERAARRCGCRAACQLPSYFCLQLYP